MEARHQVRNQNLKQHDAQGDDVDDVLGVHLPAGVNSVPEQTAIGEAVDRDGEYLHFKRSLVGR